MKTTDFLPDYEFRDIFCRVATKVDLRGANTPQEVNQRLLRNINAYPPRLSQGWISFLSKLIPSIGRRTIDEAIAQPRGIVALTLKYGKKTADRLLSEQSRKRIEYLRKKEKRKNRR